MFAGFVWLVNIVSIITKREVKKTITTRLESKNSNDNYNDYYIEGAKIYVKYASYPTGSI